MPAFEGEASRLPPYATELAQALCNGIGSGAACEDPANRRRVPLRAALRGGDAIAVEAVGDQPQGVTTGTQTRVREAAKRRLPASSTRPQGRGIGRGCRGRPDDERRASPGRTRSRTSFRSPSC